MRCATEQAQVRTLGPRPAKPATFRRLPKAVVPLVDPLRCTVDLIYELPAETSLFARDMMVTVNVPLRQKRRESVVPPSAIVSDAHGGAGSIWIAARPSRASNSMNAGGSSWGRAFAEGVVVRPLLAASDKVVTVGADVDKPRTKAEPVLTTLAANEVASLRIQTKKITPTLAQETFELTGWIMAKPGCEVTVTASVPGYVLELPRPLAMPVPGQVVRVGQPLFRIRPVLSSVEEIQLATMKRNVELDRAKADVALDNATKELNRFKPLVDMGIKQQQELEQLQLRQSIWPWKINRRPWIGCGFLRFPLWTLTRRAGKVAILHVKPGQYVTADAVGHYH